MKTTNQLNALMAIGLMILVFQGCTPVQILHTKEVEGLSLSSYSTFDFYELEIEGDVDIEFGERVEWMEEQITIQMEGKGLKQAGQDPDLLINIGMAFVEKVQTRETDFRSDATGYVGNTNYSWQSETVEVGTYEEGTVVVHLVDSKTMILVWEGIAQSVVVKSDKKSRKNISAGIKKMMADL